jgi:hypothetical protein
MGSRTMEDTAVNNTMCLTRWQRTAKPVRITKCVSAGMVTHLISNQLKFLKLIWNWVFTRFSQVCEFCALQQDSVWYSVAATRKVESWLGKSALFWVWFDSTWPSKVTWSDFESTWVSQVKGIFSKWLQWLPHCIGIPWTNEQIQTMQKMMKQCLSCIHTRFLSQFYRSDTLKPLYIGFQIFLKFF